MTAPAPRRWLPTAVVVALCYVIIGAGTAALARSAATAGVRTAARVAAWLLSALVFTTHIAAELRARASAFRCAGRTTLAVALATLLLAGTAVIHQARVGRLGPGMLLALVIWPALTGAVSFAVAVVIFLLLRRAGVVRPEPPA